MTPIPQWLIAQIRRGVNVSRQASRLHLSPASEEQPEELAELMQHADEVNNWWRLPLTEPLTRFVEGDTAPLAPVQRRALRGAGVHPTARRLRLALSLLGPLSVSEMERAVTMLVSRHDILRTLCCSQSDSQRVLPPEKLRLDVLDLSHFTSSFDASWLDSFWHTEAELDFVPDEVPAWRVVLVRVRSDQHLLCFSFHQALADGACVALLTEQLTSAIRELRGTRVPHSWLPSDRGRYVVFSRWFQHWWSGQRLDVPLTWWERQLAAISQQPAVPVDLPGLALQAFRPGRMAFRLRPGIASRLRQIGLKAGTSLKGVLLGAWVTLLYRYGGRDEVAVGMPLHLRDREDWHSLLGPFENLVTMRCSVDHPSFYQLLLHLKEIANQAGVFGQAPIEAVTEALHGTDSAARYPFRVAYAFYPWPKLRDAGGLAIEALDVFHMPAGRDVSLVCSEAPDGIRGFLYYNAERFERSSVARMLDFLQHLIGEVAHQPMANPARLPLLDAPSRKALLAQWHCPPRSLTPRLIHELVSVRAKAQPSAVALRTVADPLLGNIDLEYGLLDDWADRIASSLRGFGVGPEVPVGLFMHSYADAVAMMLGILKAGGAYVPLAPHYPPERLTSIILDTGMRVIITRSALRSELPELPPDFLVLDADEGPALAGNEAALPLPDIDPLNLAYIMYTSGSTGKAKGVAVSHINVAHLVEPLDWLDMGPGQNVLQASSLGFDAAAFEIWGTLVHGGTLVMPGEFSLDNLPELLMRRRITTLWLSSHIFRFMVDEHPEALECLQQLVAGGDVLPPLQVARFLERCPNAALINGYGPTEATTFSTICPLHLRGLTPHSAPIGKPLPDTGIYLLDEDFNPVPPGIRGEIYIAGDGLSRGYLGRAALSALSYIPSPFGNPGERLYRTGDRARLLADGHLEFLGRGDQQVKVRGFRVEPREIQDALESHTWVKQAKVLPRSDQGGNRCLVAYASLEGVDCDDPSPVLREFLLSKLPSAMVPHAIVPVVEWPLNAHGKIDLDRLPNPMAERLSQGSELDSQMASLISETVGGSFSGSEDQLLAASGVAQSPRLLNLLRDELSDQEIAESPVAALAQRLARAHQQEEVHQATVIRAIELDEEIAPSMEQARYLSLLREVACEDGRAAANLTLSVHLRGRLSVPDLMRVIPEVASRHDTLRMHFGDDDRQITSEHLDWRPLLIDLPSDDASWFRMQSQLTIAIARLPFDPWRESPWRCVILRRHKREHTLVIAAHRCIADESTLSLMLHEISELYRHLASGGVIRSHPLLGITLQYGHYARWQRQWIDTSHARRSRDFWRERLAGAPILLPLPTDKPRPARLGFCGGNDLFPFPEKLTRSLQKLSAQSSYPLSVICKTALAVLLHRYTHFRDLLLGWRVANRGTIDLENMAGPVANILPLRFDLSGNPRFWELLEHTRHLEREARNHRRLPFSAIMNSAFPNLANSDAPLGQVLFSWDVQLEPIRLPRLLMRPTWFPNGSALCDLYLHINQTERGLTAQFVYHRDLFEASTVSRFAEHYLHLLGDLVNRPEARIAQLTLQDEHSRQSLLRIWNDTTTQAPRDRCVVRLLEDQAVRAPHAIALHIPALGFSRGNPSVSFRGLNDMANGLARKISEHGIGSEDVVALSLPRGLGQMVGVLAILKAGAVVLPLATDLSPEVREARLHHAGTRLLLCRDAGDVPFEGIELELHDEALLSMGLSQNPEDSIRPDHGALISYHGPAGLDAVMTRHHCLSNVVCWYRANFDEGGQAPLLSSPDEPRWVYELFASWCLGTTLHLIKRRDREANALVRLLAEETFTRLFISFRHLRAVAREGVGNDLRPSQLRELIVYGAVPTCGETINRYLDETSQIYLCHGVWQAPYVSLSQVDRLHGDAPRRIIPGRPMDNVRLYVLDEHLNPQPTGVAGKVYVAGESVPRCFLSDAATTASRLVPNPYTNNGDAPRVGDRLFDTGYIARYLPGEGNLPLAMELIGKASQASLLHGYPICSGRIAHRLERHPRIARARVTIEHHPDGRPFIQAHLELFEEQPPARLEEELRKMLAETLPFFMQPEKLSFR